MNTTQSTATTTATRCPGSTPTGSRRRLFAVAAIGVAGVLATSLTAYAAINARATNAGELTSTDVLSLTLADNGAGMTQPVSGMLPGDVVNRHVALTNGSAAARNLSLSVTGTGANTLVTDATRGLAVSVRKCTGGVWTPTTGACSGTTTVLLTSTPVANLAVGAPLAATVAPNEVNQIQVQLTLPDSTETTVNGVLPASTVQGLSTTLTYSFTEAQRVGVTTNS